jgi:hypothetical protein
VRSRWIVRPSGLLLLGLLAACRAEWPAAERFRASLRCGLSPAEIGELARRQGATDVGCPAPPAYEPNECYVHEGSTFFSFRFEASRLVGVTRGRFHGLTGLKLSPETGLCSK